MPLYDVKCAKCNKEFEAFAKIAQRGSIKCECGGLAAIMLSSNKRDWFRPFISEDFNGEPIEVQSKEHYKRLCKEHGVYARCLQ